MKMTVRAARGITAAAIGCAAILAPTIAMAAPASPAGSPSHAVPPMCRTPGLVIWLDTNGSGSAGSIVYHLELTNLSGHRCRLNGFPFLYAINLRGKQVGHRAAFTGHPHAVTIGIGKSAHAQLRITDVFNYPRRLCHQVTAAGLKVFPPNQTRAKSVPFPFGACSARRPVYLHVGPVQNGL